MKQSEIITALSKNPTYVSLLQNHEMAEIQLKDLCRQYLPKLELADRNSFDSLLKDDELYLKLQTLVQIHQELNTRIDLLDQQISHKQKPSSDQLLTGKKITRAALARRHEKNQQEIRKDQIFVRLTPRSQSCIQFMLCNRNFPRMECKLSCNQHLQYLVNYLTNKWIRGKVGYKIVLYSDSTFLKSMPLSEKEKALKEPLNNYLMFTDIMVCCGVHQNGVLNLSYEIVEVKKIIAKTLMNAPASAETNKIELSQNGQSSSYPNQLKEKGKSQHLSLPDISSSFMQKAKIEEEKSDVFANRLNSSSKLNFRDHEDYAREASIFNRNSNFFANNDQSLFGSLGFNFGFGGTPSKKEDHHMVAVNSINYLDAQFHQINKTIQEKKHDTPTEGREEEKARENQQKAAEVQAQFTNKQLKKHNLEVAIAAERPKEEGTTVDRKLGTLMSFLQRIEKQQDAEQPELKQDESPNNNSNRIKDVKMVSIVKKRTAV